jgi:predicted Rossmann fold nucleotide-binding protein DprA/Smf involved in DNA uptake
MSLRRLTIVSGGQTGVDRGALDAALAAGMPCGGWCPAGRRAEDGPIDMKYPLSETASEHYTVRTRQNVIDSDGTLVIYFGSLAGGTARTIDFCRELNKPCYCLDAQHASPVQAAQLIKRFIDEHHIATLNVAGPRASKQVQAQRYTRETIGLLLSQEPARMHNTR